jgi:hypothetical protein
LVRQVFAVVVVASSIGAACSSTQTATAVSASATDKCQIQIANAPSSFSDGGGEGTVTINTSSRDCGWSVSTNVPWVSLSNATGQGSGSVSYRVAPNTVPVARAGALNVAGQTVTLSESAAACRFALSRSSDRIGSAGGSVSVGVGTASGCGWAAFSDSGWMAIVSGHSGSTSGFRTVIQRFADEDLTILILANRSDLDVVKLSLQVAYLLDAREVVPRK